MSFLRRRFVSWLRRAVRSPLQTTSQKKSPRGFRRQLHLEGLEDRLTPANTFINLDNFGNLFITDIGDGESGFNNDNFSIASDTANSQLVISNPGLIIDSTVPGTGNNVSSTVTIPFNQVSGQIFFLAQDGTDTLTINRSLGLFSNLVSFDGGDPTVLPGDQLIITGGSTVNVASVNYFNNADGIILLDSEVFVFSGLEPVDLSGVAVVDYTFNLTAAGDQAQLEDEGTQGNNVVQIRSLNGSFETTIFQNPSSSLTINMFDGDDVFSVGNGVAAPGDFTAALFVDGNADSDTINLSGPLGIGANNADFFAENIDVSGPLTTTGNITADAGVGITGTASGLLQGNLVVLTSAGSIGTLANPVRTNATTLTPTVGAVGGIYLSEVDSVTLSPTSTTDGEIVIDAGTNLLTSSVTADGAGRSVRLRALGGNLTIDTVTASGDTVQLVAGGAILDGNGGANNVTAASLSLNAGAGAGTVGDVLETTVGTLATNITGDLYLTNTGSLTVGVVNYLSNVTGITGAGTGTVQVTTLSPIIIATNVSSSGLITFTAVEGNDAPFYQDFITINPGISVVSTGNNVVLDAGDDVNLLAGSLVRSVTGQVTITAGSGDLDGQGLILLGGSVQAQTGITLTAIQDITLNSLLSVPAGFVSLNTNGAVLDGNGAGNNVTAQTLSIVSNTGVGTGIDGAIETQLSSTLSVVNNIGDIFVDNTGTLLIDFVLTQGNVTLQAFGGSLRSNLVDGFADVLAIGGTVTTNVTGAGSAIGNGTPLEIDAEIFNATSTGGSINALDVFDGLHIGLVNANGGNVTLGSTGGNLTSEGSDPGVADVLGNVVTLYTVGSGSIGNGGPFELNANVLNATSADNSTVRITDTAGGFAAGLIQGGTVTLIAENGGSITSLAGDAGVPDIVGFIINVYVDGAGTIGNGGPLEIDAQAALTAGTAGGNINIVDTAGDLPIALVNAGAGMAILQSLAGGIIAINPADGIADVIASSLRLNAQTGIDLETQVTNLAFTNVANAVQITNDGALNITSVLGQATSFNTGTTTTISASTAITLAVNLTSFGTLTVTAGEISDHPLCADDLVVNPGVQVISTTGDVILRAGDDLFTSAGSVISSTGAVILYAGYGDLDTCGELELNGTINAGTSIQLTAVEDICVNAISLPGGLITITSINGAITDCNDPPNGTLNITADRLLLVAATGIGAPGIAGTIETDVNFLEAQTTTGGIFIADIGSFDVGGVDASVLGIRNTGATGEINLSAAGTIRVLNFQEIIQAPGLVTITVGQDIITSGGNPISLTGAPFDAAIASSANAIILDAGRDIRIGFSNADANLFNDYGDVRAATNLSLFADRDIIVDENSYADAGAGFAGGNIVALAGRDVRILQTNTRDSRMGTFGGTITITTGAGGEFELNTGNNPVPGLFGLRTDLTSLTAAGGAGGNITINADDVEIGDVEDVINAGSATVTIRPVTAGRPIDIGTNGTGANLGLTDFEITRILAGTITIGSATSGPVTVTNPVGPAALSGKALNVITGNSITVLSSLTGATLMTLTAGLNINVTATGVLGSALMTLNFGQSGTGSTATITGTLQSNTAVNITGGAGNDTLLFNFTSPTALPVAGVFAGGSGGTDTLDGPDFNQFFNLTGPDIGSLRGIGGSYQGIIFYTSFENLAGGTADDTFFFLPGSSVSGNVDGVAGGVNKLDYQFYGSAVTINLQTNTATAIGGNWANINSFCGYSAPGICSDLIGANVNTDWQVTGLDAGTVNALPFVNFGNLFGGTQTDGFTFAAAGQLTCNIDGGAGINTITGNNAGHTYSITGVNSGAIDGLFVGSVAPAGLLPLPTSIVTPPAPPTRFTTIQNLVAGTGDDIFFFRTPGALTGTVAGGTGNNSLYGDNIGRTYTVTGGGTGNVSGILPAGYTGVQNLIGGTASDIFIVNSIGAVNTTIAGVQGADVFTVNDTGTGSLLLSGGNDSDDFQINNIGTGGALINGDAGNDRFAVRAIAGVTTIEGGADGEVANVGSLATVTALGLGNLDGITATLNLNMGSGATTINIGDQSAAAANGAVEVTNASITGFAPAVINYSATAGVGNSLALNLFGSNLGDTFNVRSTLVNAANPTGNLTTFQGGTSNDRFNLGSLTNTLDGLLGRLSVQGNGGVADQVHFLDQGQTVGYTYTIANTTFTRTGGVVAIPAITYGGMEIFRAEAGSGNDNLTITGIGATTTADVNANNGDDQFCITANTANALVASLVTNLRGGVGRDAFFVQSTAAATPGRVNMIGEAGDDQFSFPAAGILANGAIDGGDGIDTLDYSTYSTYALVNLRPVAISNTTPLTPGQQRPGTTTPGLPAGTLGLRNQTASGLFNGALNLPGAAGRIAMANATNSTIENVVGSALADAVFGAGEVNRFEGRLGNDYLFGGLGNDILIGNEGDDSIFGEAGNDTIYGAAGRDAMYGGTGFDTILIDNCNDVRPGLRTGDRTIDVGGLGPVDGGIIDLVRRVPPLTGAINDPRINFSNVPLEVFQTLITKRPDAVV